MEAGSIPAAAPADERLTTAGPAWVRGVDRLAAGFGRIAQAAVLLSCAISAANAIVRSLAGTSSNAFLEVQWYLFAAAVMLGAAEVLRVNEHVRVDLVYGRLSGRGQAIVDLLGLVLFLLPVTAVMLWFAGPLFARTFASGEMSGNAGGLVRWPAMAMLPLGFGLLLLQGLAEIFKRGAWLMHRRGGDFRYERPLQ